MLRNYFSPLLAVTGFLALALTASAVPALPNINTNNIITITNFSYIGTNYSAVGNGVITNTVAIQNAINAAAAGGTTNGLSGGTVRIPAPGTFLCGPLTLKSKVNLQIDTNAMLQMLPMSSWPSSTTFITGSGISDVEISGSGTIDGQGAAWWGSSGRPNFIDFNSSCHRLLIQDVKLQNPPTFHLMLKGNNTDITIQRITIDTPTSPNTDGMDLASSNVLVQNCQISDGDDNIEIGGSSGLAGDITITNCAFGIGHGVSIGSKIAGGVANLTVVDCTFDKTDYGIRIKSDYDIGGTVENLSYRNIGMTNITYAPILIYSYYDLGGNPTIYDITPSVASTEAVQSTTTTPKYRNIVISNVTASAAQPCMIWARTEWPATNIILSKLNITNTTTSSSHPIISFYIYNAKQIQILDSQFHLNASAYTNIWLFNSDVTFSNTTVSTSPVSLFGLTTSSYANNLAFYNSLANLSDTNTLGTGPLTMADSNLTISNNFGLYPTTVLNFTLDPNTNRVVVVGNLALGGTINATSGTGFGVGTNTLLTYTGTLSGNMPTLGTTPGGTYTYTLNTNTAKHVDLVVVSTSSSIPTTSTIQSSANPSTYGTAFTFTNTVSPAPTNGESVTFKDGSTTLGTGTLSGGKATFTTTAAQLAAGSHSITAVYAGDGAYGASTSGVLAQTVNQLALTVSGLTISNKIYDRMTAATLNTNGCTLNTVIGGDAVTLVTNGYAAAFANSNVANNISVTVASLSLGGAQAGNYSLTQPSGLSANITALGLTISGLTISNKVYDRTTKAALNTNGYALNTVIGGDVVTLVTNGYTATFANSNVANNISVTVASLSLGGAQAGNYSLTQPSGLSGNITALGLTVSGLTISNKVYDGTTSATLNTNGCALNTVIGVDAVTLMTNGYTATFASANVANGINVTVTNLSLGGAQAANYALTQPAGLTANITPAGSSILLGSSANPAAHLSAVSFTANVTPSTLGGTVLFLTNGVAFNSQTLSGGAATSATTAVLPRGTNLITAQYSGSSNYSPSTNTLNEVVTNNPPTANPAVCYRLVGNPLTIIITNLATNWSDLDGDPLVLAGVSTPSTNGGAVTFDSANIYYHDGNNVTDRFGYTISDGQGGTNSGIVTVLMAQQNVSNVTVSNGGMTLEFSGIPGSTYWVEVATNLAPPDWQPISTNTAGTNGLWQFTDTQVTNFLQRFYRSQLGR